MIKESQKTGSWVCLQNCHLAVSWMPVLEKLWEEMSVNNTNINFRLWLTSYPSDKFPTGILQAGIKMINEPPSGLQQNLLWSFLSEPIKDPEFFSRCPEKEKEFSKLLYGLCFFHSIVQGRKQFGSIGWNVPYVFDESDFQISLQQLQMFINDHENIPFETLLYMIGECNYGGRVTDEWDRRTLMTILADFINKEVVTDEDYIFTHVGSVYGLPHHCEYRHYLQHIQEVPSTPPPQVFGLHTNAGITRDLHHGNKFFDAVLEAHSLMTAEQIETTDNTLIENIKDILNKLPPAFDLGLAKATYEESLNAVLVKELEHLNILVNMIFSSLVALQKALKGFALMSPELEALSCSLVMNKVPTSWTKLCLPSSKYVASFINNLLLHLDYFQTWYSCGLPSSFWMPGFFFAHSFLTAILLNYGRKFRVPVQELGFDFFITSFDIAPDAPQEGCYISGLFLDGARWDKESETLQESRPTILQEKMPLIHVIPRRKKDLEIRNRYVCPMYKTLERRGELSTMGLSNNYIISILLNTDKAISHWIKRGVALICQVED